MGQGRIKFSKQMKQMGQGRIKFSQLRSAAIAAYLKLLHAMPLRMALGAGGRRASVQEYWERVSGGGAKINSTLAPLIFIGDTLSSSRSVRALSDNHSHRSQPI